jgi:DNA-binding transcriptional regulator LsrR (DeoR family)
VKIPGQKRVVAPLVPPAEHLLYAARRLYWHGALRRKDIESTLGVSSDYARRLIARLRKQVSMAMRGKA